MIFTIRSNEIKISFNIKIPLESIIIEVLIIESTPKSRKNLNHLRMA